MHRISKLSERFRSDAPHTHLRPLLELEDDDGVLRARHAGLQEEDEGQQRVRARDEARAEAFLCVFVFLFVFVVGWVR